MFSSLLLDHFAHPRNVGEIADADVAIQMENPACGDILRLTAKVANGYIREIRFRAKGCVPAIACASALTELAQGKNIAEAQAVSRQQLTDAVGGVPAASGHAVQLALDALAALLGELPG